MVRLLDKTSERHFLEQLFGLLHENMQHIAPSGQSYEEEKAQWIACVGEALEKPPRQMLLLYAGETLAGFCMYYIHGDILMVEEVQIKSAYRRSLLSVELFRFVQQHLLPQVRWIEAYADQRNVDSQRLMEKLGMKQIGSDGNFLHFRGDTSQI